MDLRQELLERKITMLNETLQTNNSQNSQKQVDMLCDSIRKTGNDILVETKFGKIHVYLNGNEVQNVDAVQTGAEL